MGMRSVSKDIGWSHLHHVQEQISCEDYIVLAVTGLTAAMFGVAQSRPRIYVVCMCGNAPQSPEVPLRRGWR